jgi:methylthioribose-1-phosphate isomerase
MKPIFWENQLLRMVDQTKLPTEYVERICRTVEETAIGIEDMIVRGAPAIGITAAYGVVLGALEHKDADSRENFDREMRAAMERLAKTRPTAVNLFWALNRMEKVMNDQADLSVAEMIERFEVEAIAIHDEDIAMCKTMGKFGADLIPQGATILTHCNAGALATGDYGTALGVIRAAYEKDPTIQVFADETRPYLQGARLTAYELHADGIPVTLITDNMAGHFMKAGRIQAVVVGADRIASNGDVANKIGTYGVAVLAKENNIPFYVAAPTSTIDFEMSSGDLIPIEQRNAREVTHIRGVQIAPDGIRIENPAFDVTPNRYIAGIITEKGVAKPPYEESIPALEE